MEIRVKKNANIVLGRAHTPSLMQTLLKNAKLCIVAEQMQGANGICVPGGCRVQLATSSHTKTGS